MDFERAKGVLAALEAQGVRYAVVGGAALNLLGLARFTPDLDLFLAPEAANIERAKAALRSVFEDPSIEEIDAQELLGDYLAVQYVPPEGSFHVDLLTRLRESFRFEDLVTMRVPFEDLMVTIVSPRTFYRMRRNTERMKDRADAALVRERFGLEEE